MMLGGRNHERHQETNLRWGAWVAQSVEGPTSAQVMISPSVSSSPDLTLCEFEPRAGLWADSSEPGACFVFCFSLSLCPSSIRALLSFSLSLSLSLSLSKTNKHLKNLKVN